MLVCTGNNNVERVRAVGYCCAALNIRIQLAAVYVLYICMYMYMHMYK